MGAFDYRQAEEIRDSFACHAIRYLFIGKSGAILLGYPDTGQDVELYVENEASNCQRLVDALGDLGFRLTEQDTVEVLCGKDFIQLKDGPFDLDLIFAPDGIERFEDAWSRRADVEGFPVCHIDDIVSSKQAANRAKDKESLPRLLSFREWLKSRT